MLAMKDSAAPWAQSSQGTLAAGLADRFLEKVTAPEPKKSDFEHWLGSVSPHLKWGWDYLRLIRYYLNLMDRGEINRLMILMPPQHGKSNQVTVHHAAHTIEKNPAMRIVIASYDQRGANKFSRQIRRLVADRMPLSRERNAAEEWETMGGGSILARGLGSGVTGRPADRVYIDDPLKGRKEADSETVRDSVWEWYTQSLMTRLSAVDQVVLIQTRWHEDDLAGRILAGQDGADWTVVEIPAIATNDEEPIYDEDDELIYAGRKKGEALNPALWTLKRLERFERTDERGFNALFQQRPTAPAGAVWKREWWRIWDTMPRLFNEIILSVDPAFRKTARGSWVVLQVWGRLGANVYLLDQMREHMGFVETEDAIKTMSKRWPQITIKLIESKANGDGLIDVLHGKIPGIMGVDPEGLDKEARADSVTWVIRAGNVYIPNPSKPGYGWAQNFIDECATFPLGRNDDQVDAAAYALRYFYPPIYGLETEAIEDALGEHTGT